MENGAFYPFLLKKKKKKKMPSAEQKITKEADASYGTNHKIWLICLGTTVLKILIYTVILAGLPLLKNISFC